MDKNGHVCFVLTLTVLLRLYTLTKYYCKGLQLLHNCPRKYCVWVACILKLDGVQK